MNNNVIEKFKYFFENEVKDSIPKLVHEYAELLELTTEEEEEQLKNGNLKNRTQLDSSLSYIFMDEPYVYVEISEHCFKIDISDQNTKRLSFTTTELDAFIRYWNTEIVSYFGQNVHLPEIIF